MSYSWKPLSPEASTFSPHTHTLTQRLTRTSGTFYTFAYKQTLHKHLTPGIILGWDFLSRNQLGIIWGPTWTLQLRDNQDTLIQTVEETKSSPAVLAAKCTIPPQSLVLVLITATLPPYDNKVRFDIIPL